MDSSSSQPHFRLPTSLEPAQEALRLPPVEPPKGVWIDWGPAVPAEYGQDRLCLMVRDPGCVFAYWELTGPHATWIPERHGVKAFAEGKWQVRLFSGRKRVAEVPASHPLGTYYFAVEADANYRAEVGLALPAKEWIVVASSAEVRTPRAWIAAVSDDDWAVTEEEMLLQLGFTAAEAARRAALVRRMGMGRSGHPGAAPGPGSSSR